MNATRLLLLVGAAANCLLTGTLTFFALASPETPAARDHHQKWFAPGPVFSHVRHASSGVMHSTPFMASKETRGLLEAFSANVNSMPTSPHFPTISMPGHADALSLAPVQSHNTSHLISRLIEPVAESASASTLSTASPANLSLLAAHDSDHSHSSIWRYSPLWTVALCVAYLVVFFLGLVGNLSVLWVIFILRRNSRHSMFATCNKVFNGLIGNLALADLLVIIFCLPATLISNIFTPYFLGRFVCKATQYFQGVSVSASVYTLVAISIDRFYGIYFPFNNGFSQVVRRSVIIFIWFFSFSIAIPWILFFDLVAIQDGHENGENHTILMCQEVWPDQLLPDLYFLVVNFGLQYLVPLSIILVFYMLLMMKIWRRKIPVFHTACRRETSTDTVDQWNARIVEQSKMKVLKMLLMIVSLFACSWLPLYLIFLKYKFGSYDENSYFDNLVMNITPLAQWLGASNSCVNPILYFFFNAKFRSYLKKALTRSLLCSSSIEFTRNHIYYNPNNTNNNIQQQPPANTTHVNNGHNQLNCTNQKTKTALLNGASLLVANSNNNNNGGTCDNSNHHVATALNNNDVPLLNGHAKGSHLGFSLVEQVDATLRIYCCQNGKTSPSPPPATLDSSLKPYECDPRDGTRMLVPNGTANGCIAQVKDTQATLLTVPVVIGAVPSLKNSSAAQCYSAENVQTVIQFGAKSHNALCPPKYSRETSV